MATSVEYIWCAKNTHTDIRSKTRTLYSSEIPEWNFDGSSTGHSEGLDTEITLRPVYVCSDPFRERGKLALCDCWNPDGTPNSLNTRAPALKIFQRFENEIPWFGLEQEYVLMKEKRPMGWPLYGEPDPQGKYYCGNGADRHFARPILEEHYQACLKAGLTISGFNVEVMPGQYEFQIGPVEGIGAADQLIMARYLLIRVSEKNGIAVNYHPKPMKGNWNGSGLHHNFSTQTMRNFAGYTEIRKAIDKMEFTHSKVLEAYGEENHLRLTGIHETSSMAVFTHGVGTRHTSVRIPNTVFKEKKGYFEDRRPAANADPYLSTSALCMAALS